jgi:hypothetical protein
MSLEELNGTLVPFGCRATAERTQISSASGLWILLA